MLLVHLVMGTNLYYRHTAYTPQGAAHRDYSRSDQAYHPHMLQL